MFEGLQIGLQYTCSRTCKIKLHLLVLQVKPAFGAEDTDLRRLFDMGMIAYSEEFTLAKSRLLTLSRQVLNSDRDGTLVSVLLEGAPGSGKTAVMASLALESGFAYVKLIRPDKLIQHREDYKTASITKVFEDAYKTQLAMILIDDVEHLLEYANVQSSVRFSNMVLQALMVLLKRRPPSRCCLMVVVTTSVMDQMQLLHFDQVFYSVVSLPNLTKPAEVRSVLQAASNIKPDVVEAVSNSIWSIRESVTIKALLNALETAIHDCNKDALSVTLGVFMSAMSMSASTGCHARDK